ncbi:MAG: dipeptidyl-peptidase-3 [Arenicella sp.]|jgi:dipeptidyl-peptidase-3
MKLLSLLLACCLCLAACDNNDSQPISGQKADVSQQNDAQATNDSDFEWSPERFADIKIIRYQIAGFEELTLKQKELVYYLVQAGLAGRDIMWDQNYRHNLSIRRALEAIMSGTQGSGSGWQQLSTYARQVFFSNGIHHHYAGDKFTPNFTKAYFLDQLEAAGGVLNDDALEAMFDPSIDNKKVSQNVNGDLVKDSAINFYDPDLTDAEVTEFYAAMSQVDPDRPVLLGLNSKVVRLEDGSLAEKKWTANGMYGSAITKIIGWLDKAVTVAENPAQADALKLLIEYYKTGDLKTWDDYNIAWVSATDGDVDYIHSFIEVYQDPKGYKGSFENIVQIKDFEASRRMQKVASDAQWFEDNSSTDPAHKKEKVVGVSYNVVSVAGESGDASPSTPVGVNLPNSNWIRAQHGSKSVSLGNIVNAYGQASNPGLLAEFAHDKQEIALNTEHKELAGKMRTALHEVVGHASGKLEAGVGTPKETLKNYSSPLEEARADLVALYFMMDPKLVELGLLPSLDVGKAAYDSFILNGLMLQLRRIEPGKTIEQAHMRNRQMVAGWVFQQGTDDNVISKIVRDGKIYFEINDYLKLRQLFGQLLKEVQRIKSQGDYQAGRDLIENYGVQVDAEIHQQVLSRSKPLDIPPYSGFINPTLTPIVDDAGVISDVSVEYPKDFVEQMLEYGREYSHLPNYN